MKRILLLGALVFGGLTTMGAGCAGGDSNIESARLNMRTGDLTAALGNVDAALRINPANAEALEIKGQILSMQATKPGTPIAEAGEKARAAAETYRTLAQNPAKANVAATGLGRLYGSFYNQAVSYFQRGTANPDSTGLFGTSYDYVTIASSVAPDSAAAYQVGGYALLRAGRNTEAITQLRLSTEKGIDEEQPYLLLARLYLDEARTEAAKYDDAIAVLRGASARFPGSAGIQAELLNAYTRAGRLDEAMQGYRDRIAANPNDATARMAFGTMLLNANRYDEAIEQLREATQLAPTNGDAFYNLGAAYTNQAAAVNRQINEKEDALQRNRSSLSTADRNARQAEIDALKTQRNTFFNASTAPLDRAREIYTGEGKDVRQVCTALFQAYTYSGQTERAAGVRACAGL
ncbi:MAG: tetratricopeptide repeat protein [Bacteroidetes bacterium]|nr:tetratricopeptide repeat protein [Bacteroidota bacterium]